jgi:hypothetical protein
VSLEVRKSNKARRTLALFAFRGRHRLCPAGFARDRPRRLGTCQGGVVCRAWTPKSKSDSGVHGSPRRHMSGRNTQPCHCFSGASVSLALAGTVTKIGRLSPMRSEPNGSLAGRAWTPKSKNDFGVTGEFEKRIGQGAHLPYPLFVASSTCSCPAASSGNLTSVDPEIKERFWGPWESEETHSREEDPAMCVFSRVGGNAVLPPVESSAFYFSLFGSRSAARSRDGLLQRWPGCGRIYR